ncbi:hypothetical protein DFH06DRAFT_1140635 [Mycena polygramma]|nr:hypothetical protein DFH06DRAFT_1140635 [Mycena polygramma]
MQRVEDIIRPNRVVGADIRDHLDIRGRPAADALEAHRLRVVNCVVEVAGARRAGDAVDAGGVRHYGAALANDLVTSVNVSNADVRVRGAVDVVEDVGVSVGGDDAEQSHVRDETEAYGGVRKCADTDAELVKYRLKGRRPEQSSRSGAKRTLPRESVIDGSAGFTTFFAPAVVKESRLYRSPGFGPPRRGSPSSTIEGGQDSNLERSYAVNAESRKPAQPGLKH